MAGSGTAAVNGIIFVAAVRFYMTHERKGGIRDKMFSMPPFL